MTMFTHSNTQLAENTDFALIYIQIHFTSFNKLHIEIIHHGDTDIERDIVIKQ